MEQEEKSHLRLRPVPIVPRLKLLQKPLQPKVIITKVAVRVKVDVAQNAVHQLKNSMKKELSKLDVFARPQKVAVICVSLP